LNRLNMNNFLLSGDPRDEDKVNKGLTDIIDQIKRGESNASSEAVRNCSDSGREYRIQLVR